MGRPFPSFRTARVHFDHVATDEATLGRTRAIADLELGLTNAATRNKPERGREVIRDPARSRLHGPLLTASLQVDAEALAIVIGGFASRPDEVHCDLQVHVADELGDAMVEVEPQHGVGASTRRVAVG